MRIVLSGGGTAGHINPALALAEVLQERGHEVFFAGTPQGVEARLVKEAGIPFTAFEITGFNRNHPLTLLKALRKTAKSTQEARRWFNSIKPDVVVGFGGYVCIPVGRAAKKMNIPLVIHEQNSVMGLANKYLAKSASAVALTYDTTSGQKDIQKGTRIVTGNPVRSSVLRARRADGRVLLGLTDDELVLLVFGGSLGARHINEALIALKDRLLAIQGLSVVHLTGSKEYDSVREALSLSPDQQKRWLVFDYQDKMGEVLAASDVVVARAGATSLAEISARRIPALLVPFPFATEDHQTTNAKAYVDRGAAYMVADSNLEGEDFTQALFALLEKPEIRADMQEAAGSFDTQDAAGRLADVVIGVGRP